MSISRSEILRTKSSGRKCQSYDLGVIFNRDTTELNQQNQQNTIQLCNEWILRTKHTRREERSYRESDRRKEGRKNRRLRRRKGTQTTIDK